MIGSVRFMAAGAAAALAAGIATAPAQALTQYDSKADGFLSVSDFTGDLSFSTLTEIGFSSDGSSGAGVSDFTPTLAEGDGAVQLIAEASGEAASAGSAFSVVSLQGGLFVTNNGTTDGSVSLSLEYLVQAVADAEFPTQEFAGAGASIELWQGQRDGADDAATQLFSQEVSDRTAAVDGESIRASESFLDIAVPTGGTEFYLYARADGDVESVLEGAEVPVPAALPLGLSGLAALGALAWRRRR